MAFCREQNQKLLFKVDSYMKFWEMKIPNPLYESWLGKL